MVERGTALFESWRGRCADSPRAISEALREARPELHQTWVVESGSTEVPAGSAVVRRHSPAHFAALQTARWVVTNDVMPRWYVKSPHTTYVQTWHGTPLKKIGFDVAEAQYAKADAYRRTLLRDVRKWDHLVSPSPYCTDVFRQAFDYTGSVLELGYPRNDVLVGDQRERARKDVRRRLDLADDQRAVLYAPTWRDDAVDARGRVQHRSGLDLERLLDALGPRDVVLLRLHRLVSQRTAGRADGRLRDVSDHPDMQELCVAADVLVTDYSSVMFDFALTDRPVILFVSDLERYRDDLRGFYFDVADDPPGPMVRTTDEVASAVLASAADTWSATWRPGLQRFRDRFCPYDDGEASRRVVEAVFGSSSPARTTSGGAR